MNVKELRTSITEIDQQLALLDQNSRKHAQQARILVARRFRLIGRLEDLHQPVDDL